MPASLLVVLAWSGAGAAVLGAMLLILGVRGRRVGTQPVCKACDFDLTGLRVPQGKDAALTCPECSVQLSPRDVRRGKRERLWILAICGVLLSLGGFAGLTPWAASQAQGPRWVALKPDWLLLAEVASRPDDAAGPQIAELDARMQAGTLSQRTQRRLIAMGVQRLTGSPEELAEMRAMRPDIIDGMPAAVPRGSLGPGSTANVWVPVVASAGTTNALTLSERELLLSRSAVATLVTATRSEVRVGSLLRVLLGVRGTRVLQAGVPVSVQVRSLEITDSAGKRVPVPVSSPARSGAITPRSAVLFDLDLLSTEGLSPGPAVVRVQGTMTLSDGAGVSVSVAFVDEQPLEIYPQADPANPDAQMQALGEWLRATTRVVVTQDDPAIGSVGLGLAFDQESSLPRPAWPAHVVCVWRVFGTPLREGAAQVDVPASEELDLGVIRLRDSDLWIQLGSEVDRPALRTMVGRSMRLRIVPEPADTPVAQGRTVLDVGWAAVAVVE